MLRSDRRNGQAVHAIVLAILAGLPACNAPGGHGLLHRDGGVTVVPAPEPLPQRPPYFASRPAFPLFRPKTFTLSNYAGANYPTVIPRAAVPVPVPVP
jgi:hypothetical protein